MKLLIVDDEPRNLDLLEAHLAPLGHELVRATGGREALQIMEQGGIDLVLLDLMMPDLDGIDVLLHLRAREGGVRVPVVLVTAMHERAARLRGLEASADEFLEKPIDGPVLRARVQTLLRLKHVVDALEQRNTQLEQLQKLQHELTQFIVHDLKNPIGVVQANVEYALGRLGDRDAVEEMGDALRDADDAARRLLGMAEDLLLVARSEDAVLPVRRSRIAVRPLLDEVRRRHLRTAEERSVVLEVIAEAEPELVADKALLARALDNLVDNALRFTPRSGRVEVAAHVSRDAVFTVSNTGRAIPPAQAEHIFEKFARVGGPDGKIERVGPGMGLYFCRRAAEAHGGHIELVETADWPARFVMHLPGPVAGRV